MEPEVSVIVTSYNKARFLPQALDSVRNQTFKNWECFIVDDNSDDGSWEIAQKVSKEDHRFKAVRTDLDPSGHSIDCNRYTHNINLVIPKCAGEFITYLCDDDLYKPNRLYVMVEFLRTNPSVMVCYGEQELQWLNEKGEVTRKSLRAGPRVCYSAAMVVDHSSVMHGKEVFGIVGNWPEGKETWRCGDAAFWEKLNKVWPFHRISEITDVHRFNDLSVSNELDTGTRGVSTAG